MPMHPSREMTTLSSQGGSAPDGVTGTLVSGPDETLTRTQPQYWALGIGVVALFLVTSTISLPLSCVEHSKEEAESPAKCHGLAGDPSALRLPDFCWTPCFAHTFPLLVFLSLGLVMQAIVVLLNHRHCTNWLRVTWYFDLHDILGMNNIFERFTENVMLADIPRALSFVRRPLERKMQTYNKSMKVEANSELIKSSEEKLVSVRAASIAAQGCVGIAVVWLCVTLNNKVSLHSVYFECGDVRTEHRPKVEETSLIGLGVSLALLLFVLFLQRRASWTVAITVKHIPLQGIAGLFKYAPPGDQDGHYFLIHDAGEKLGGADLRSLRLKMLVGVRHQQILYPAEEAMDFLPQDSSKCVLFFRDMDEVKQKNEHRQLAIGLLAVSALLMHVASVACWSCVRGIVAFPDMSVLKLNELLLVMGACGRHVGVGRAVALGCILLVIAIVQQLVVISMESLDKVNASRSNLIMTLMDFRKSHNVDPSYYEFIGEQPPPIQCHVWVKPEEHTSKPEEAKPVTTASKRNLSSDPNFREVVMDCKALTIQRASAKQFRRSTAVHTMSRHVDHQKGVEHAGGEVVDDTPRNDEKDEDPTFGGRVFWRRSLRPRTVRLTSKPVETVLGWGEGLQRTEYSPSSVSIELDDAGVEKHQVVPSEFVAGHFHTHLNLGPGVTWDMMSGGLAACGTCLAIFDFIWFFYRAGGGILNTCDDILNNSHCVYFHPWSGDRHKHTHGTESGSLVFRHSVGPYLAVASAVFGLLGALTIRVAHAEPTLPAKCSCKAMQAYGQALQFSLALCGRFLVSVCSSLKLALLHLCAPSRCGRSRMRRSNVGLDEPLFQSIPPEA